MSEQHTHNGDCKPRSVGFGLTVSRAAVSEKMTRVLKTTLIAACLCAPMPSFAEESNYQYSSPVREDANEEICSNVPDGFLGRRLGGR
jgi:hypothetical protein